MGLLLGGQLTTGYAPEPECPTPPKGRSSTTTLPATPPHTYIEKRKDIHARNVYTNTLKVWPASRHFPHMILRAQS